MTTQNFTDQTKSLIDSLKTICANYGLGNDGNEFKIISQVFLYMTNTPLNSSNYVSSVLMKTLTLSIWKLKAKRRF